MIRIRDVIKKYVITEGNSFFQREEVYNGLENVSLNFPDNGMFFILGKHGSGKYTLLNVIAGIDNVDNGSITVNNKNIVPFSQIKLDNYRNAMISFIFQNCNLVEDFNVLQNIALASELQNKEIDKNVLASLLKEFDFNISLLNRKIHQLSGGQKQIVGIIRALMKKSQIILADEPTGNLDMGISQKIFDKLKAISKEKLVIIVTHDQTIAYKYADRIIKINNSHVENILVRKTKPLQNQIPSHKKETASKKLPITDYENYEESFSNESIFDELSTNVFSHAKEFDSLPSHLSLQKKFKMTWNFLTKSKRLFITSILYTTMFFALYHVRQISLAIGPKYFEQKSIFTIPYEIFNNLRIIYEDYGTKMTFLFVYMPYIISILILYNTFNINIKFKKKNIGILRLLGANIFTVFKIILVECFLFAFTVLLLTYFIICTQFRFENPTPKLNYPNSNSFFSSYKPIPDKFNATKEDRYFYLQKFVRAIGMPQGNFAMLTLQGYFAVPPFIRFTKIMFLSYLLIFFLNLVSLLLPLFKISILKPIEIMNK
ncbi:ABC transporter ATP-binding protein [Candidatus Phytoplasma melaleucae]|uniref:ABC transporter ATP-binding protein n=1 Tax=Candidatus Phytoplasma melaleucae TaxID=2982630 RepID=A0ABT9DF68_9MOLU|nr:ABC transporter ATP-binding protein ['Melaleuca sp.' phytoplasma]MDO8167889.1 ABC transporter ATP-binding protein ['Melaleuca sp.' phytoplasma]